MADLLSESVYLYTLPQATPILCRGTGKKLLFHKFLLNFHPVYSNLSHFQSDYNSQITLYKFHSLYRRKILKGLFGKNKRKYKKKKILSHDTESLSKDSNLRPPKPEESNEQRIRRGCTHRCIPWNLMFRKQSKSTHLKNSRNIIRLTTHNTDNFHNY